MIKYINFLLFPIFFVFSSLDDKLKIPNDEIIKRIESIINNKDSPLLAGGLAVIKDNQTLFCKSIGKQD